MNRNTKNMRIHGWAKNKLGVIEAYDMVVPISAANEVYVKLQQKYPEAKIKYDANKSVSIYDDLSDPIVKSVYPVRKKRSLLLQTALKKYQEQQSS